MSDTVIVGLLALAGTLAGSLGGIVASGKLTAHRIGALEKKVEKHNNAIERLYRVEERAKSNTHRLDALEKSGR